MEKQFVPPHKRSDKSQAALDTPHHVLVMLRFMMKSLSQRLKKAAARDEGSVLLVKAWYSDHMHFAQLSMQQYFNSQGKGLKRCAPLAEIGETVETDYSLTSADAVQQAKKQLREKNGGRGGEQVVLAGKSGGKVLVPKAVAAVFKQNVKPNQVEQLVEEAKGIDSNAVYQIFGVFCKNCFYGGAGLQNHSMSDCRQRGNPFHMKCNKCKVGKHWSNDCPGKR